MISLYDASMMQETLAGIVNTSTAVTHMYVDKLSWSC